MTVNAFSSKSFAKKSKTNNIRNEIKFSKIYLS